MESPEIDQILTTKNSEMNGNKIIQLLIEIFDIYVKK